MTRGDYSAVNLSTLLQAYQDLGEPKDVIGLDLAGDEEIAYPTELPSFFREAKDRFGLGITIHAGETGRVENARSAVELFGADRIGHQKSDEQIQHELEVWKTQTSTDLAFGVELLKGTIEAGQTAVRSAIAINRGAAVAMLAFVGNAMTKWQTGGPLLSKVGAAMLVFVLSAGFGGTAAGFRYLTQFWYSEARYAGDPDPRNSPVQK
ncbi:hypothetical protein [Burkholderia cepacia]|uniref:hypothetical protein n=1 Tax=Burkholderia cepacia TaxID=292 RepID=UPI002AB6239A|nr:hypothetical protein [Burkholderia cepacia]